eukprot:350405-Pyramimonas_sp.AAC.1
MYTRSARLHTRRARLCSKSGSGGSAVIGKVCWGVQSDCHRGASPLAADAAVEQQPDQSEVRALLKKREVLLLKCTT